MAGFVLIFIIFPILIVIGLIMLYYGKWRLLIKLAAVFIILLVCLGAITTLVNSRRTKIQLTRDDVIGKYEIDTSLYPGKNSDWQFKTYSFELTQKDSIFFRIKSEQGFQLIKGKLQFSPDRSYLFRIINDTPKYHVLQYDPTFYRGHEKFYISFFTKYNTMFFRKKQ